MKIPALLVSLAFLSTCAQKSVLPSASTVASAPALPTSANPAPLSALAGKEACFLLYDVRSGRLLRESGGANCDRRLTACSTFKVPAALMGFDAGILKDENTGYRWDGRKRSIESWNQDHTATSWMKNSVVWFTQKITPKLGLPKMKHYLRDFRYGNEDLSSGILTSWLTVAPFLPAGTPKGSLQISPREQLEFVRRWWKGELAVSPHAVELTKKITFLEKSPGGVELHGKTGSGFRNEAQTDRIGWFISHLEGPKGEYITVLSFTDTVQKGASGYAGLEARELTKKILAAEGLW
jgi:beta-lactamase class D